MPYIAFDKQMLSTLLSISMKKTLAILALALFIGGLSVPVIASNYDSQTLMELRDEDPKKIVEGEKTEKKAETSKEATKSGDCTHEKKASDCSSEAKPAKSSGGCEK